MTFQKKFFILFIFFMINNLFITHSVCAEEPTIYSQSAILMDLKTGNVLYEKNSNTSMYPASTTKVLTAIIAIETCPLTDKVTASEGAITSIKSGYTNAKIQVHEQLTMEDLLYALLLNSANEAANVIAEYISGSTQNFANLMNEKATELGCTNSHFVNAHGIHDDNHYTTASDLAKITRYCMQNETFQKMVSTLQYSLPATEQYPSEDRILKNTNGLLIPEHTYYYPYAIGVKSGFTSQAKNCLISASHKDDIELISVVLHAESTEDQRSARYLDSITLLEYGNNNYDFLTMPEEKSIGETITRSSITRAEEPLATNKNDQTQLDFKIFLSVLLILIIARLIIFFFRK